MEVLASPVERPVKLPSEGRKRSTRRECRLAQACEPRNEQLLGAGESTESSENRMGGHRSSRREEDQLVGCSTPQVAGHVGFSLMRHVWLTSAPVRATPVQAREARFGRRSDSITCS